MAADNVLLPAQAMALIPQQRPFRFIDEMIEISPRHAIGRYTFRHDEFFYAGHFPDRPVTPGVVLLEAMGQTSQGICMCVMAERNGVDSLAQWGALFTDGQIEMLRPVLPGTRVTCRADLVFFRMGKLRASVSMMDDDGQMLASGVTSGVVW